MSTRVSRAVPRLRNHKRCRVIRRAMFAVMDEPGFRICEFSVQRDHVHLICEAKDQKALAAGIKRFKQRVAFGLNRQLGRKGPVFLDRYHMEVLGSPRRTRNALAYVLLNARKHGERLAPGCGDPYSSGYHFTGWRDESWKTGLSPPPGGACVSPARTWLLTSGWRRHGLLAPWECPGPIGAASSARARGRERSRGSAKA